MTEVDVDVSEVVVDEKPVVVVITVLVLDVV